MIHKNSGFDRISLFFFIFLIAIQSSYSQEQWFPIGPAAIKDGQTYGGRAEASGRATVIAVNPFNPQDVWMGASNGGVWHTTNAGLPGMNWKPMTDDLPSLAIGAITLQDCNSTRCNTIYIGTGENNIRRHTYYGRGLYKIEWIDDPEFSRYRTTVVGNTDEFFKYGAINDIIIDGTDLYVSVSEGRASSAAQVTIVAPEPVSTYGVFKSDLTGTTWTKIEGSGNDLPTDLELMNGELFAGFSGKGIFKLNAAGTAWCPLNPGNAPPAGCSLITSSLPNISEIFDHIELAAAPNNQQVIYAMFGKCPSIVLGRCTPELYQSTNGGSTWEQIMFTSSGHDYAMETFSRYTHALEVHPTDPNTVIYGGVLLNKSINSGETFITIGNSSLHPDLQDFKFPVTSNPDLVYAVSDGGFYFSEDGGECWNSGNYDLQITSFYSIGVNTQPISGTTVVPPLVIGGVQDNGTNLFNGSRMWQHIYDGDGGDSEIQDPNTMFASTYYITPKRSTNGGGGFFNFSNGIDTSEQAAFYPPYLQHPITKDVYFGTEKLYKSPPTGIAAFVPISPDFDPSSPRNEYAPIETGNVISAVALAPSDANRIYVGLYDGSIWSSDETGPCPDFSCWTKVGGPGDSDSGLPNAVVSSLAVDPINPEKVFVTYSGFNLAGGNHVYVNTNSGNGIWGQKSDGLPPIPTHSIKINPSDGNNLWLGTDQGVFKSNNGGDSWETFGPLKGMPNVPVYDFAIDNFNGRVYAATHGRGAFMLTTSPVLYTFEGWMDSEIWDILVYGEGFIPDPGITECTVEIILENGDVCAGGTVDSYGDTVIQIGSDGSLVTDRQFVWEGREVIAACLNGDCVGGVDIENCLDPTNRIASIKVTCGGQVAFARISEDCPQQANPPSSVLDVESPSSPTGLSCASMMLASMSDMELGEAELDVMVTLASTSPANGGDRILCGTRVKYDQTESPREIAIKIQNAINESTSCAEQSITAQVPPSIPQENQIEDFVTAKPRVSISAPSLVAGQLILSIRSLPKQSTGSCFSLRNLGQYALNQLAIMRSTILTEPGGAKGGEIIFTESSHLGTCTISIPTSVGQSAESIASDIYNTLTTMTEPGTLACEARQNPYDLKLERASLVTVMADGLTICTTDPGVGFASGPDGLDLLTYIVDNEDSFEPSVALSIHGGFTSPLGAFNTLTNSNTSLEVDLEYQFAPHFSLEALAGKYNFTSNIDVYGGGLFLKGYLLETGLRPFASAGLGLYKPSFDNLSFGISAGMGLNFPLFGNFEGELGLNYHYIFNSNPKVQFLNTKVGLKYRF